MKGYVEEKRDTKKQRGGKKEHGEEEGKERTTRGNSKMRDW